MSSTDSLIRRVEAMHRRAAQYGEGDPNLSFELAAALPGETQKKEHKDDQARVDGAAPLAQELDEQRNFCAYHIDKLRQGGRYGYEEGDHLAADGIGGCGLCIGEKLEMQLEAAKRDALVLREALEKLVEAWQAQSDAANAQGACAEAWGYEECGQELSSLLRYQSPESAKKTPNDQ